MDEISSEEVDAALFGPHTIYAPDGTTFVARLRYDPTTIEQVLGDQKGWMNYELQGPGDKAQLWVADRDGEFIPDPTGEYIPATWPIKAKIALQGWVRLLEELEQLSET